MEQGTPTTPLVSARLAALGAALDALVIEVDSGGLDHLDHLGLVAFLQDLERVRNRTALVDHRALRDAEARDLAGSLGQGRLSRVLTQALRISPGEAARRLRGSEQVGDRVSMLGERQDPLRPVLAAAQRDGAVTPEQVDIVCRGLAKVDRPGYDPLAVADGERLLTGWAASFGTRELQACTDRFVDHLDPDGTRPRDLLDEDRRHVEVRAHPGGGWRGELHLTGPVGAKLRAVLAPLARPRLNPVTGPRGGLVEAPDERTHGQRMHDALEELCDRVLRGGNSVATGGVPTTVLVTIDHDSLLAATGYGTVSDGTLISTERLLELADEAEIIPAVLDRAGAVLTLGRSRRIASRSQTLALVARDGGCSFPGCDRDPQWCERHHITAWIDGGRTDLDNLTLLCRYHHHQFAARGWSCHLDADRRPVWVPPRYVDPEQRPLQNARVMRTRAAPRSRSRSRFVLSG